MDAKESRTEPGMDVIDSDLEEITQSLDSRHNYLVLEINTDCLETDFIERLQGIIHRLAIVVAEHRVCRDRATDSWFLVFRLAPQGESISFESLYFDLPAGVEFHCFHRSPVNASEA